MNKASKHSDLPICGVVDVPTFDDNKKLVKLIQHLNKDHRVLTKINAITKECVDFVYHDITNETKFTRVHFHFDKDKWEYVPTDKNNWSWANTINRLFLDETKEEAKERARGEMLASLIRYCDH